MIHISLIIVVYFIGIVVYWIGIRYDCKRHNIGVDLSDVVILFIPFVNLLFGISWISQHIFYVKLKMRNANDLFLLKEENGKIKNKKVWKN